MDEQGGRAAIGIDVGGTRTKAVVVCDGAVLARRNTATPEALGEGLVDFVVQVAEELVGPGGVRDTAVGVAIPGLVDDRRGVGVWSANLGWSDLPVANLLRRRLPGAVVVMHDVRAGLVGERRFGAAQGHPDVLFVPLGTGVAAALMVAGELVVSGPWSGEIGHVQVRRGGPECGCGAKGCLEVVAGAKGLQQSWQSGGRAGGTLELVQALATDDPLARELWEDAVQALARVLAPVVATAGVDVVVIGGGLAGAGDELIGPLRRALADSIPGRHPLVVTADLGDEAAALGVASLAQDAALQGAWSR